MVRSRGKKIEAAIQSYVERAVHAASDDLISIILYGSRRVETPAQNPMMYCASCR